MAEAAPPQEGKATAEEILEGRRRRACEAARRYRAAHAEALREKRLANYDPEKRHTDYLRHWKRENEAARRWSLANPERSRAAKEAHKARKRAAALSAGAAISAAQGFAPVC